MFEKLITFATVSEELSLTQAAEKLGISKAQVSRRLAELEKELGCQLLNRSTRKVKLTDAGKRLLPEVQGLYLQYLKVVSQACQLNDEVSGRFTITYPSSIATSLCSQAITRIMKTYPKLKLELRITSKVLDLIDEGVDLAIRTHQIHNERYIGKKVREVKEILCCHPSFTRELAPCALQINWELEIFFTIQRANHLQSLFTIMISAMSLKKRTLRLSIKHSSSMICSDKELE
nr:LysR family transcriptional regulator [Dongshaea marina]